MKKLRFCEIKQSEIQRAGKLDVNMAATTVVVVVVVVMVMVMVVMGG